MNKKQYGDNRRKQLQSYLSRDLIPYFEGQGYEDFDAVDQALDWLYKNYPEDFRTLKPNKIESPTQYLPPDPFSIGNSLLAESYSALRGRPYNFMNTLYGQSDYYPGGQRSLSEVMGVTNPLGSFALDMMDPVGMAAASPLAYPLVSRLARASGNAVGKLADAASGAIAKVEDRYLTNKVSKLYENSGWEQSTPRAQAALEKLHPIMKRAGRHDNRFNRYSDASWASLEAYRNLHRASELPFGVLRPINALKSETDLGLDISRGAGANNLGVFRLRNYPGYLAKKVSGPNAATFEVDALPLNVRKDLPKNVYPPIGLQMHKGQLYSIMREAPGNTLTTRGKDVRPTFGQYRDYMKTYRYLNDLGYTGDIHGGNIMYDPKAGFSFIDLSKVPTYFNRANIPTASEALRKALTGYSKKLPDLWPR